MRQIDAATARAGEARRPGQAAGNAAAGFAAQQGAQGIEALILDGARAGDVAAGILRSSARQGLQAALAGAGPFAALFGTQGQNGAPGGLFGALGTALVGRRARPALRASSPKAARSQPANGASWARRAPKWWRDPPP